MQEVSTQENQFVAELKQKSQAEPDLFPMIEKKSISLLLGSGFSVPQGYPTGNQLNEKLLNCIGDNFIFHTAGQLCTNEDGTKPNIGFKTPYDFYFDFCKDLIHYYNDNIKDFDYEEFYDFYKNEAKKNSQLKEFFAKKNYGIGRVNFEDYLYQIDNIYNQLVEFYLKDRDGKTWYDDEPFYCKSIFYGYTGFLDCIEALSKKYIINVHTLNHDLFFERLNNTEWIKGELCDGFEELGSPFYGELRRDGRTYKCRLSRYTGKYEKKIRLYKLHGSLDYFLYYKTVEKHTLVPDVHLKSRYGIGGIDLCKEIKDKKGNLIYEKCSTYHPDFLTGTTSKILRYNNSLLYRGLFEFFKKNLNDSEMLIVIGYGCKDLEINNYILKEFGVKKPCFVVDPITDNTAKLGINSTWINKQIANIQLSDFKI